MTVEITLPDQLALEAQQAGLLAPEFVERWLEEQLRARRFGPLVDAMDRMSAVVEPPYMSSEEVAEEMRTRRAERQS